MIGEDKELLELERPIYERGIDGEYNFDDELEYDRDNVKLDRLLVESLTEHFHMRGIIPTVSQISEASRIDDNDSVFDILEELGYDVKDDSTLDNTGRLRVYER